MGNLYIISTGIINNPNTCFYYSIVSSTESYLQYVSAWVALYFIVVVFSHIEQ